MSLKIFDIIKINSHEPALLYPYRPHLVIYKVLRVLCFKKHFTNLGAGSSFETKEEDSFNVSLQMPTRSSELRPLYLFLRYILKSCFKHQ